MNISFGCECRCLYSELCTIIFAFEVWLLDLFLDYCLL